MAAAGTSGENVCELIWENAELAALNCYRDHVFESLSTNGFRTTPFTRAQIGLPKRDKRRGVSTLMLFEPGFDFLLNRAFGCMGDYSHELEVPYKRLETFVRDKDHHARCMEKVFNSDQVSQTAITLAMAVHLFGNLTPEGALTVNKHMKKLKEFKDKCPCGCGEGFLAGDTGIGLSCGWHGFPDLLVHDVPVVNPNAAEEAKEEQQQMESVELNQSLESLQEDDLDEPPKKICRRDPLKNDLVIGQMVATTITNSYAQATAKPKLRSKLVPAICCSKRGAMIYGYNIDEDLFLSNQEEPFSYWPMTKDLNLVMVVEIWLALNSYLTGAESSSLVPWITKSRFQEIADATIYEAAKLKVPYFEESSDLATEFFTSLRTEYKYWSDDLSFEDYKAKKLGDRGEGEQ